jgi:hemolysin D
MSLMRRSRAAGDETLDFVSAADRIEREPIARGMPLVLHALLACLISAFAWAALSRVDEVVSSRGRLVSIDHHVLLQASEPAQIATIRASVGQPVSKGDVLVTFDATNVGADQGQVRERFASLDAQVRRLEAERDSTAFRAQAGQDDAEQRLVAEQRQANFRARLLRFDESLARARKSLDFNAAEIQALEGRLASLREIEAMNEDLADRQFQSRRVLLDSREKRLEAERNLASVRGRTSEIRQELLAIDADRAAFVAEHRQRILEELVLARRERDALAQQLVKADRRSNLSTLSAPVDGVVLEVARVAPGSVVREAQVIVTLVPVDAQIEAEVRIENADVSGVKEGDAVRVKIDAFPFQRHGVLTGRVRKLSPDTPTEAAAGAQQVPAQYLARIAIDREALAGRDRLGRLLPGMTLSAEILTGSRTVLSYLSEPLIRLRDEALNER